MSCAKELEGCAKGFGVRPSKQIAKVTLGRALVDAEPFCQPHQLSLMCVH